MFPSGWSDIRGYGALLRNKLWPDHPLKLGSRIANEILQVPLKVLKPTEGNRRSVAIYAAHETRMHLLQSIFLTHCVILRRTDSLLDGNYIVESQVNTFPSLI
jgi:hypothetical protein